MKYLAPIPKQFVDQKAMFVIGNGTAENNRKDVFKVDQSGNLWCMVNGTLTNVSTLLANI